MAKGYHQKLKLSYLTKIMLTKTDEEHFLTMPEIIQELEAYGMSAERKSIYADFKDMEQYLGIEILKEKRGREIFYAVVNRDFELAEIKLLIDAVQSSKFMTQKKSQSLIKKIKTLVSQHQAKELERQVFIANRVKTMNESVYYTVDHIHHAIHQNCQIQFKYYQWNVHKKLVARHEGQWIQVSPWALSWEDENYYMVAYDSGSHSIKHYRVDKMMKVSILQANREGKELFDNFDMASYSKATFGMYSGEIKKVHIRFANELSGIFIDRFGKEVTIRSIDESYSELIVDVAVSPQFYGWIFGLGSGVKVTAPREVVCELQSYGQSFLENYKTM